MPLINIMIAKLLVLGAVLSWLLVSRISNLLPVDPYHGANWPEKGKILLRNKLNLFIIFLFDNDSHLA